MKRLLRLVLMFVLAFAGLVFARGVTTRADLQQPASFEAALAKFDADVAQRLAADAGGFVSVAVFRGDTIVWSKGYGMADIELKLAANDLTIGRIGSISKTFTAVALMQLVERGTISLDDPVEKYLPEIRNLAKPPAGAKTITFRMLASHTAGLQREPGLPDAAAGPIAEWENKVLASIPTTGFLTPPGTAYAYSNIGFGILGLAVSRAAKTPFMDLVTKQVLTPLAMTSSTYVVKSHDLLDRLAVGYMRDAATGKLTSDLPTREHLGRGYKVPNGGIYSTTGDLARFAAALMGEGKVQVLTQRSREEMMRPQAPSTVYGFGLMIRTTNGETFIGHGGSVAGYNADLLFNPRTKLGVAVLRTTSYNPPTTPLLQQLVATR
jgi:CubicO group peptidase (beta-lactamase class C family)